MSVKLVVESSTVRVVLCLHPDASAKPAAAACEQLQAASSGQPSSLLPTPLPALPGWQAVEAQVIQTLGSRVYGSKPYTLKAAC